MSGTRNQNQSQLALNNGDSMPESSLLENKQNKEDKEDIKDIADFRSKLSSHCLEFFAAELEQEIATPDEIESFSGHKIDITFPRSRISSGIFLYGNECKITFGNKSYSIKASSSNESFWKTMEVVVKLYNATKDLSLNDKDFFDCINEVCLISTESMKQDPPLFDFFTSSLNSNNRLIFIDKFFELAKKQRKNLEKPCECLQYYLRIMAKGGGGSLFEDNLSVYRQHIIELCEKYLTKKLPDSLFEMMVTEPNKRGISIDDIRRNPRQYVDFSDLIEKDLRDQKDAIAIRSNGSIEQFYQLRRVDSNLVEQIDFVAGLYRIARNSPLEDEDLVKKIDDYLLGNDIQQSTVSPAEVLISKGGSSDKDLIKDILNCSLKVDEAELKRDSDMTKPYGSLFNAPNKDDSDLDKSVRTYLEGLRNEWKKTRIVPLDSYVKKHGEQLINIDPKNLTNEDKIAQKFYIIDKLYRARDSADEIKKITNDERYNNIISRHRNDSFFVRVWRSIIQCFGVNTKTKSEQLMNNIISQHPKP